jgi:predicted permease
MLSAVLITPVFLLGIRPLLRKLWDTKDPQYTTIFQTISRYHGFIALAIVLELFGEAGTAVIALSFAVLVPINQFINIVVLVVYNGNGKFDAKAVVLGVVKNPIFIGAIVGLVISFSGMPVWKPVITMLDLLGQAALGLSLLALGAGLSLKAALKPSNEMWVGVLGRLFGIPLLTAALCILFGVTGMSAQVMLILASVPAAMNGYVLAKKMGGDAELYASTLTVQVVGSFITVPIVIWLSSIYFA